MQGETRTGFKFDVDDRILTDWRFTMALTKAQNGKVLGFMAIVAPTVLKQFDLSNPVYYADLIEKKTLPNSSRWFTFDIERLDNEWFIWTYTYPNGRKDSWEMKRVQR